MFPCSSASLPDTGAPASWPCPSTACTPSPDPLFSCASRYCNTTARRHSCRRIAVAPGPTGRMRASCDSNVTGQAAGKAPQLVDDRAPPGPAPTVLAQGGLGLVEDDGQRRGTGATRPPGSATVLPGCGDSGDVVLIFGVDQRRHLAGHATGRARSGCRPAARMSAWWRRTASGSRKRPDHTRAHHRERRGWWRCAGFPGGGRCSRPRCACRCFGEQHQHLAMHALVAEQVLAHQRHHPHRSPRR